MSLRLPIHADVEYRGVQAASTFTRKDTGEIVNVPAKLKFEYESPDGDVALIPVSGSQLDKCSPPIDYNTFERGDAFELIGLVVLADRGSDRDSFFTVTSLVPATVRSSSSS